MYTQLKCRVSSVRCQVFSGKVRAALFCLFFLLLSVQSVYAAGDWYVTPTGAGNQDGTSWENAFDSIQAALDAVEPGDTIHLGPGNYFEDLETKMHGTEAAPIMIVGSKEAILRGSGNQGRIFQIFHDYYILDGWTIDGFGGGDRLRRSNYRDKLIYVHGQSEPYNDEIGRGPRGLEIKNMHLLNAGGECIRLRYFVQYANIHHNTIHDCGIYDFVEDDGGKNGEAIYVGTSSNQWNDGKNPTNDPDETNFNHIHHNIIDTQGNECIEVKEGGTENLIEYNDCTGGKDANAAGLVSRGDGNTFRFNETYGHAGGGIRFGGHKIRGHLYGVNNDAYENSIYDNALGGIKFQSNPQNKICGNRFTGPNSESQVNPAFGSYDDDYAALVDVPCEANGEITPTPTWTPTPLPTSPPSTPTLEPTAIETRPTATPSLTSTSLPTPTAEPTPAPVDPFGERAEIRLTAPEWVGLGEEFDVIVEVRVADLQVDGAAAYIDFDTTVLEVASVKPGPAFPIVLQNQANNQQGKIDFAAGTLERELTGRFVLAEIRFRATGPSSESAITLQTEHPRQSNLTFNGSSILRQLNGTTVEIQERNTQTGLTGQVELEGRGETGTERWVTPLNVTLHKQSDPSQASLYTSMTDARGKFEIHGLAGGSYYVAVKGPHSLQNIEWVALTGETEIDFGGLREGDATDDNMINILDFSLFASGYNICTEQNGFVENADFDEDGCTGLADFSLLAQNFGLVGEAVGHDSVQLATTRREEFVEIGTVSQKEAGERFTVNVVVNGSTTARVDAASFYLKFNPDELNVVNLRPGEALDTVIENHVDNQFGDISYTAGILGADITTPFILMSIEFEAVETIDSSPLRVRLSDLHQSGLAHHGTIMHSSIQFDGESTIEYVTTASQAEIYLPLVTR